MVQQYGSYPAMVFGGCGYCQIAESFNAKAFKTQKMREDLVSILDQAISTQMPTFVEVSMDYSDISYSDYSPFPKHTCSLS